jgi:hypothetical protein
MLFKQTLFSETWKTKYHSVGFEVLTTVVMKSSVFWDITPCSSLQVGRRFGRWRRHVLPKCRLIFSRLQSVTSRRQNSSKGHFVRLRKRIEETNETKKGRKETKQRGQKARRKEKEIRIKNGTK